MKKIIALTTLSLLIFSCKKEKPTPAPVNNEPTYSYPTTVGSYWVYDRYQVDSLGNETLLPGQDSVKIVGDTLVNGKTYLKFQGSPFSSGSYHHYERDSSGFIVDIHGSIVYSFNNVAQTFETIVDNDFAYSSGLLNDQTIATAFGMKNASVYYYDVFKMDGSPINSCGDLSARFYHYYVSGIGMVQSETEIYTLMMANCSKKRSKLSSYYIAP